MLEPKDCVPGNKVVCIRLPTKIIDSSMNAKNCPLKVGAVYTIEDYFPPGTYCASPEIDAIACIELYNGNMNFHGWSTQLFRPIEPQFKQFYDMLDQPLDDILLEDEFEDDEERETYLIQAL